MNRITHVQCDSCPTSLSAQRKHISFTFFKFKTPPSWCGFKGNNPHPQKSPGLQLKHSIIPLAFVSLYQTNLPPGFLPLDKAGDWVSWIRSPTTMTSSPSLITCAKNEDYKTVRRACGTNHSQENVSLRLKFLIRVDFLLLEWLAIVDMYLWRKEGKSGMVCETGGSPI